MLSVHMRHTLEFDNKLLPSLIVTIFSNIVHTNKELTIKSNFGCVFFQVKHSIEMNCDVIFKCFWLKFDAMRRSINFDLN